MVTTRRSRHHQPRQPFVTFVAFLICLFPPPLRGAQDELPSNPEQGQQYPIDLSQLPEATVIPVEITEEHFRIPPDWDSIKAQVLHDVIPMLEKLDGELEHLKHQHGTDLYDTLMKNETKWEIGTLRGEITPVDGHPVFRVIHGPSKLSLFFVPEEVTQTSDHLKQIIARQHIDSGDPDPKGRKPGRDTVIVTRSQNILTTRYFPRHIPGSPEWWGDYARATFKTKKLGDYALAAYCTALQMGAAACISGLRVTLGDSSTHFEWSPILLSGLFAALIGSQASSYRVWTYRGSETSKLLKLSEVGLLYAYSLALIRDGAATVFNFTDPSGLLLHASILWNTALNQKGRVAWQKLAELRDKLRYSAGQYDLTAWIGKAAPGLGAALREPNGDSKITISKASFFNQTLYLIPFSCKLIGLIGIGAKLTLPLTHWKIDTGPLLLVASIPAALYVVSQYAKRTLHNLRQDIAKTTAQLNKADGDVRQNLEAILHAKQYEEKLVADIATQLGGEQTELWRNIYKPHHFLKRIGILFVDTGNELYSTWYPIAKNTVKTLGKSCADWLLAWRK